MTKHFYLLIRYLWQPRLMDKSVSLIVEHIYYCLDLLIKLDGFEGNTFIFIFDLKSVY